eukprot:828035-Pelagomonas_calceolata.AAC.7
MLCAAARAAPRAGAPGRVQCARALACVAAYAWSDPRRRGPAAEEGARTSGAPLPCARTSRVVCMYRPFDLPPHKVEATAVEYAYV